MELTKNSKILIVGLGFIGGSYAMSLSKKGYHIGAISKNKKDIDFALENHLIESGTTRVSKKYISQFDIVIFCLYPKVFLNWITKYHHCLKDGAIVTDVCGVKKEIVYKAEKILLPRLNYVSSHPMAGKEVYGVRNADNSVFKNANFIITPTSKSNKEATKVISSLASEIGFSKISYLSVRKHDEMIAFLSQLTHCIAVSLMTCKQSHKLKDYTGDSFRDLTRIANINEKMWSELFIINKSFLVNEIDNFTRELIKLKESILNEDIEQMQSMMKLSTYRRSFFNKKK